MPRRQPHCLQSYRKRNALRQEEMAFLLGCNSAAKVSQYEQLRRQPNSETMMRCQAIFGVSSEKLFPVLYRQVEQETKKRARELAEKVRERKGDVAKERKLAFLNGIIGREENVPAKLPWENQTLATA